eukprot:3941112-Rhodomonas_salina.1
MSGTDLAYAATQCAVLTLRPCCAMFSTDRGYAATPYPTRSLVLPAGMLLRACYALSGTDLRYAPTQPCEGERVAPTWY